MLSMHLFTGIWFVFSYHVMITIDVQLIYFLKILIDYVITL